ncbi:pyridoxal-phosphate dependent enzyme [bacterium]|nr:pyridoxal-phosphate dependent enzyme [bacterium]
MNQPLIFQKFPELAKNIPWLSLGTFPTAVQRLTHLEKATGLSNLWIKRDDLSGKIYGGNKVRTLEFSLADALEKKANLVFAYSALGSNWPLACSIYTKMYGLPTDVFFLPYPMDDIKERNLQLTRRLSGRICSARSLLTFPFLLGCSLLKSWRSHRVYLMPPGGVSAVTTLGYVNAVLELKEQCEQGQMPVPDYIFVPLGSGGTAAGLAIGLDFVGWSSRVIAVRVVDFIVANRVTLHYLIKKTIRTMKANGANIGLDANWKANIRIEHRFFGKGYGLPTPDGQESAELVQTHENQLLDATYTSKTMAAMLEFAKEREYKNKTLLFWHTLNSRSLEGVDLRLQRNSA